jgi:peptidyl-prolyl cis-trans isomerase B (cyclophilin B)
MVTRALAVVPALLLMSVLTACGDDGSSAADDADDTTSASSSEETEETGQTGQTEETDAAASGACTYTEGGQAAVEGIEPPPADPARSGKVPVVVETSVGELQLELDAKAAPCTVNSFVSLAEQGYYDDTSCHRMTTSGIFVLQCGDPTGTGAGGPGYQYDDELTGSETYPAGTLAMANAGPNTNGSQFFVVYADTPLPPSYTVFGTADKATVRSIEKVAAKGTTPEGDGAPKTPVDITSVTVGGKG